MNQTNDTIIKLIAFTGGGAALSVADIEQMLRIASLLLGSALSIAVYVRGFLKEKKEKKNKPKKD